MLAILDHLYALKRTFQLLLNGKFLLYFIPGIVIAILYLWYLNTVSTVNDTLGVVSYIPWVGSYLEEGKNILFGWVEGISLFVYQFLIITALSPFHTLLSEKIDTNETGNKFDFGWEKVVNDIVRTLGVVILGGLLYLGVKLIWMLLAWIVGISFLNPVVSAIIIGFFTGFNSYDYCLERYDISVYKSWKYAWKHPLHMIITGGIFSSLLFIPYIGVVIAPVFLTIVGTICFLRIRGREVKLHEQTQS